MRRPADHADAAVAQLEQVARRGQPAVPVGGADRGHAGGGSPGGIDDDERDAAGAQAGGLLLGELGDDEDDAGGTSRARRRSTQRAPERAGPSWAERTTPRSWSRATSSTPRMISIAHGLSSSLKTTSSRAARRSREGGDGDNRARAATARRARASGGRDVGAPVDDLRDGRHRHPAASATSAIVTRPLPFSGLGTVEKVPEVSVNFRDVSSSNMRGHNVVL